MRKLVICSVILLTVILSVNNVFADNTRNDFTIHIDTTGYPSNGTHINYYFSTTKGVEQWRIHAPISSITLRDNPFGTVQQYLYKINPNLNGIGQRLENSAWITDTSLFFQQNQTYYLWVKFSTEVDGGESLLGGGTYLRNIEKSIVDDDSTSSTWVGNVEVFHDDTIDIDVAKILTTNERITTNWWNVTGKPVVIINFQPVASKPWFTLVFDTHANDGRRFFIKCKPKTLVPYHEGTPTYMTFGLDMGPIVDGQYNTLVVDLREMYQWFNQTEGTNYSINVTDKVYIWAPSGFLVNAITLKEEAEVNLFDCSGNHSEYRFTFNVIDGDLTENDVKKTTTKVKNITRGDDFAAFLDGGDIPTQFTLKQKVDSVNDTIVTRASNVSGLRYLSFAYQTADSFDLYIKVSARDNLNTVNDYYIALSPNQETVIDGSVISTYNLNNGTYEGETSHHTGLPTSVIGSTWKRMDVDLVAAMQRVGLTFLKYRELVFETSGQIYFDDAVLSNTPNEILLVDGYNIDISKWSIHNTTLSSHVMSIMPANHEYNSRGCDVISFTGYDKTMIAYKNEFDFSSEDNEGKNIFYTSVRGSGCKKIQLKLECLNTSEATETVWIEYQPNSNAVTIDGIYIVKGAGTDFATKNWEYFEKNILSDLTASKPGYTIKKVLQVNYIGTSISEPTQVEQMGFKKPF